MAMLLKQPDFHHPLLTKLMVFNCTTNVTPGNSLYLPHEHTGLVSSELFHSQGSYHSSNAECLMLIQICRKTKTQETGPVN